MSDDVAIQHVERIEMPNVESKRRYGEESSGEEERTYRRRRRRRRSDQRKKDYVSEEDSESEERSQDSRTRPRRKRKESEDDDRRRRRKKDRSGESSTDENGNRRRSRRRNDSSYESEEEEENGEDHYKVKHGRKKHYSMSEESEVEEGKDKKKKSKRESDEDAEKEKNSEEKKEVKEEAEKEKETVEVEALVHTEPEVDKENAATLLFAPETEEVITPEPQQVEVEEGEESLKEKEIEGEESISKEEPDTIDETSGKYGEEEESRLLDEAYQDALAGQEQGEEERMFFRSDKKPAEMYTEGDGEVVRTFRAEDEGKKREEEYEESYHPRKGKSPEQPLSSRKRRSYLTKTESEERDEMVSRMADVDTVIKGVRLGDADGR